MLALAMIGAAVGAPTRWLVDQFVQTRHDSVFPWGTFLINVTGSFALGALQAGAVSGAVSSTALVLAGTGFCGGFTTFSTFGYESVRLMQEGSRRQALLNVIGSMTVGLVAAIAGWSLVQALA